MMAEVEAERLRILNSGARTRFDPQAVSGSATLLAQTTKVQTYPTGGMSYFAMLAQTVLGTETEGTAGTLTASTGIFYALNLGTAIPPQGTTVICTFAGNRWVFRYDG